MNRRLFYSHNVAVRKRKYQKLYIFYYVMFVILEIKDKEVFAKTECPTRALLWATRLEFIRKEMASQKSLN